MGGNQDCRFPPTVFGPPSLAAVTGPPSLADSHKPRMPRRRIPRCTFEIRRPLHLRLRLLSVRSCPTNRSCGSTLPSIPNHFATRECSCDTLRRHHRRRTGWTSHRFASAACFRQTSANHNFRTIGPLRRQGAHASVLGGPCQLRSGRRRILRLLGYRP